jgi:hypothetical protein
MTNITASLLVLTLTGTPVASVTCGAVCQPAPVPASHCHDDVAASGGPLVFGDDNCGEPSLSDAPYLVEQRAMTGAAVLVTSASSPTLTLARMEAPAFFAAAPSGWLAPPLVLRL